MNVRHALTARAARSRPNMIRRLAIMFTEEHRHEATTASFHHGICHCPDCKLGHPRFLSKLVEPQSALQLARACRRFPPWRGQRLGEVGEHEIEGNAHTFGRAFVGGNVVPEPGREDHHAARLRLRDAGVGGDAADRGGPRHDEDRPRVLENEV